MKILFSTKNWNRVLIYLLFICSTFSIAGTEASIVILYLITLIRWLRNRPLEQLENPFLWITLFFIATTVISGLFNSYETDHLMALRNNWRLLLPLLLAGILTEINSEQLLWVFFGFVFLISVYGIIQYFTGADWLRPEGEKFTTPYFFGTSEGNNVYHAKGNFTHHLTYGGFLLLSFPLLISFTFCKDWYPFSRILTALIAIFVLIAIGASLGRSIWLGTAAAVAILMFRIFPKLIFTITIAIIATSTYLFTQLGNAPIQDRIPTSYLEAIQKRFVSGFMLKSNQDRILMWESGISAIKDHFWMGIGYNNDADVMPEYRKRISKITGHRFQNSASSGVHNIYIQTWLNYGFFGILGYLGILAIFFFQTTSGILSTKNFNFENSILWAGISGVCGFMIAGLFENNFRDGEVQAMLMILMGLCFNQTQKLKNRIFKS